MPDFMTRNPLLPADCLVIFHMISCYGRLQWVIYHGYPLENQTDQLYLISEGLRKVMPQNSGRKISRSLSVIF